MIEIIALTILQVLLRSTSLDKCRSPLKNFHFNRAKQLVMLDTNFIQFYFDKNVAKSFLKMWGKWRYHGMGEAGRRCQEMAPKPFYARVDIHISPHGCTHTQRKLKWKSETQHQILLSKHRFELCVGVCRLIVEERGQVSDNWIQLCQTEYLIPFGRRPVRIERQVVRQLYNSHSPRIISHHLLTPAVTAH